MSDGTRALEIKSVIHTWCDGCHHDKKHHCGTPLLQVNCPISWAIEALRLYEREKEARKLAEQREWARSPRDDR